MTTRTQIIAQPDRQEIIITRTFDAPVELVFKTWTDPKSIQLWWGPAYLSTSVGRMEVRNGGKWRIVQRDSQGNEHAFHGVYHAVDAPHRIVSTFEYEGTPGHVSLDTFTFEAQGGKTRYTGQSVFQSVADRDGMLRAGCESGMMETMDRMAELLKRM
ncbi:MAG: SRPBCC family protein [Gallionella sp.]